MVTIKIVWFDNDRGEGLGLLNNKYLGVFSDGLDIELNKNDLVECELNKSDLGVDYAVVL